MGAEGFVKTEASIFSVTQNHHTKRILKTKGKFSEIKGVSIQVYGVREEKSNEIIDSKNLPLGSHRNPDGTNN